MTDINEEIQLADVYADEPEYIKGKLEAGTNGVLLQFEGFVDYHGAQNILIENQNGIPHVVIWGDINSEDPTHIISLEGAAESKRIKEEEEPCLCGRGECPECGD